MNKKINLGNHSYSTLDDKEGPVFESEVKKLAREILEEV